MQRRSELHRKIGETLLSSLVPGTLYDAVHELHALYSAASGISAGDPGGQAIYLSSGKAICPGEAAHCLLEFSRTAVFLRGIVKAIHELKKRFPGERLHVVYAGCGPYATLITPLLWFFKPDELSIELLDINEQSLVAVEKLYTRFGLLDFVDRFHAADATSYRFESGKAVHLVISETLNAALKTEPFVSIVSNLVPQLAMGGIFIPEQVTVKAGLLSPGREHRYFLSGGKLADRVLLGTICTIGQQNSRTPGPIALTYPVAKDEFNELTLLTEIDVYGGEVLGCYECSLTLPQPMKKGNSSNLDYAGKQVVFRYRNDNRPGFEYEIN